MLFTILLYDADEAVAALSKEDDDALVARHLAVQEKLAAAGRLGPVVRLSASGTAKTYRPRRAAVTDGPFAETKEQLLGLYVVDCPTIDDAVDIARSLPVLSTVFEVRPVALYFPGGEIAPDVVGG
ncbi:MAG: YciI family protein [Steroidobacter sp.]